VRHSLARFFNTLPSDAFSFIAGAVFSVSVNLGTNMVKSISPALLLLTIGLLAASTIGFVRNLRKIT